MNDEVSRQVGLSVHDCTLVEHCMSKIANYHQVIELTGDCHAQQQQEVWSSAGNRKSDCTAGAQVARSGPSSRPSILILVAVGGPADGPYISIQLFPGRSRRGSSHVVVLHLKKDCCTKIW